jgi:hypothetical protein
MRNGRSSLARGESGHRPSAGDRQKLFDTNYPFSCCADWRSPASEAKDVIALATARALKFLSFPAYREVKAQINGPLATLVGRLASQGRGQAQYWRHRAHPSDPL